MRILFLFFAFMIGVGSASGQATLSTKNKKAIELYTQADNYRVRRQYPEAIGLLNEAIEKDKNFMEAYYRLGLVYFNMRTYPKAIAQFEKALTLTSDLKKQKVIWFDLGEAYLLEGQYEKAQEMLSAFLKNEILNKPKIERAKLNLRNADFALQNKKENSKYNLRPLSDTVNRFVMQYFPVLTADQSELIFTRRVGYRDADDEDLVVSRKGASGRWLEPVSISNNINSLTNEGTATISADGRRLIFTSCAGRDSYGSCDLFESNKIGNEWSTPRNLGTGVNSGAWESQPTLAADGRTLFFVSDRRSGLGQRDIWMSTMDEKGLWTKAVNVGPPINSEYDEMSPFIHVNGQSLFFATNALPGFGGYDLYVSERDSASWTTPRNIGAPVNNHDDQFSLFITADGGKAYYSHEETRDDGYSVSKIYEVSLPEENWIQNRSNYVKGIVRDKETKQFLSARIELVDLKTNRVISLVESDSLKGDYLMVLTSGAEYALYVTKQGYLFKSLNFNYSQVTNFEPIIVDIELEKVRTGSVVVLNNIFFDTDKYELKEKSTPELQKIIRFLNDNPGVKIQISGHTDNVGAVDYNIQLSLRRATSVFQYLIDHGIDKKRVLYKGFGASRPVADNSTESGRQLNRRIEVAIVN
jgi:OmpA-OmpF porin, OOP family